MMYIIIVMIFITFASKVTALEKCDILGSLEADPLKKTLPVKFEDLKYLELIEACNEAIEIQDHNIGRYYLLRARGYLRSGSYEKAITDIKHSHDIGYAAATFALATLHHFGEAMPKDLTRAEFLYKLAYKNGVKWAAQGLSILYKDISFFRYDLKLSHEWLEKFLNDKLSVRIKTNRERPGFGKQ